MNDTFEGPIKISPLNQLLFLRMSSTIDYYITLSKLQSQTTSKASQAFYKRDFKRPFYGSIIASLSAVLKYRTVVQTKLIEATFKSELIDLEWFLNLDNKSFIWRFIKKIE